MTRRTDPEPLDGGCIVPPPTPDWIDQAGRWVLPELPRVTTAPIDVAGRDAAQGAAAERIASCLQGRTSGLSVPRGFGCGAPLSSSGRRRADAAQESTFHIEDGQ